MGGERDIMGDVFDGLARWTSDVVYSFGYQGVAALIALQNLFPPVPSALILPLAGFLIGQGRFSFFPMLLAATTGSVSSALVFYVLGYRIGEERLRKFVGRFGRYALVEESDLDRALGWFGRYGGKAVLFGRLVPGVGTFVSVPAGFARMPVLRFVIYTALGTALWNGSFIGLGWALGSSWRLAQRYLHTFEYGLLASVAVAGVLWYLWRWWRAS
jgi:membrane protein DedA with SNARE-associated domain